MDTKDKIKITVQTKIKAPVEKVWKLWTTPEDIVRWNSASDDWHTPKAENNLMPFGKFLYRMEARDGSAGFDFGGVYDEIKTYESIKYTLDDGRKVRISFNSTGKNAGSGNGGETEVVEIFEAEKENPVELQISGWQAILNNFKKYVDSK